MTKLQKHNGYKNINHWHTCLILNNVASANEHANIVYNNWIAGKITKAVAINGLYAWLNMFERKYNENGNYRYVKAACKYWLECEREAAMAE